MSDSHFLKLNDFELPRRKTWNQENYIAAPSEASFTLRFGHEFPKPQYLSSDLGTIALYELPPSSGKSKYPVLIIHGLSTPALGMLSLARELQSLHRDAHVVLFDLWGHGFSSTPLVAHTPQIFHFQIFQVLGHMQWARVHLVGYSFGASTAVRFSLHNPRAVISAAILGPAGLLKKEDFSQQMQTLLDGSSDKDTEAAKCVLSYLEGGALVVPPDWQEQTKSGNIVAEALRQWSLQEHPGYPYSVLSAFREGGVFQCEEYFQELAKLPLPKIGIVGGLDPVCSKSQLVDLGFKDVSVVEEADHAFVRTEAREVAGIVNQFWTQQEQLVATS